MGHSPTEINFAKPKQPADTKGTKTESPPTTAKQFLLHVPRAWKWTLFLLGIPSLYIGFVSMIPLVTIEPQELLKKDRALSFPIRVTNNGYTGINSVELECVMDRIQYGNGIFMGNMMTDGPIDLQLGDLSRGGYATSTCDSMAFDAMGISKLDGTKIFKGGHITLTLTFRPDFSPFKTHRRFYLIGLTDEDSRARWLVTSK